MTMRRRRAWSDQRVLGTLLAASGTIKLDLLANLGATETKTATRVIMDLHAYPPVTNALNVDRSNLVDVAIGVVSAEAFTAETLPDPDAAGDYPQAGWLYVASKPVLKYADSGGPLVIVGAQFTVDLRAQRKVDRGVLFLTVLNIGVNGSDAVEVWGRVRTLCLT